MSHKPEYSTGDIDLHVPVGHLFLSDAVPCREKLSRILEVLPVCNTCSGFSCMKEKI